MPLYDYECPNCETEHQRMLSVSDGDKPTEEDTECPNCLGMFKMKRLMPKSVNFIDPVRLGVTKPPMEFKETLKEIHRRTPGSQLGDKV